MVYKEHKQERREAKMLRKLHQQQIQRKVNMLPKQEEHVVQHQTKTKTKV